MKFFEYIWSFFYLPSKKLWEDSEDKQKSIWLIISFVYLFNAFYSFKLFQSYYFYPKSAPFDPLWPIFYFKYFDFVITKRVLFSLNLVFAITALILPKYRFTRFMAFFFCLSTNALIFSYGKIGHASHLYMFCLFGLLFMHGKDALKDLISFLGIQALILLTYSMSGFWKFIASFYQLVFDTRSAFSLDSMAQHLAHEIQTSGRHPIFEDLIVNFPAFFTPVLLGGIYIELFSLWIIFRPKLHRVWGLILISLHIGTYLTLSVGFPLPFIFLGAFLVLSPLGENPKSLRDFLFSLPWLGTIFLTLDGFYHAPKRIIVFYDGDCGVCNKTIKFFLHHSKRKNLYAPLYGQTYLTNFVGTSQIDLSQDDSIFVLIQSNEFDSTLKSSQAIFYLLASCGRYSILSLLMLIPSLIPDFVYAVFAPLRKKLAMSKSCDLDYRQKYKSQLLD